MLQKAIISINRKILINSYLANYLLRIPKCASLRNYSALFRSHNLMSPARRFIDVHFIHKPTSYSNKNQESEDIELPNEFVKGKNTKIISKNVQSLRLDIVIKAGFNISRNKTDEIFYQSKIRVNGQKILKKSHWINIGDEIDLIQGPSKNNENFLVVNRIIILSAKNDGENFRIQIVQDKSLLIENYETEKC